MSATTSKVTDSETESVTPVVEDEEEQPVQPVAVALTSTEKKKRMLKSEKCGLVLPVGRINTILKKRFHDRVSPKASIMLAATLEYIVREWFDNDDIKRALEKNKRKRISPAMLELVLVNDLELGVVAEIMGLVIDRINAFPLETLYFKRQKRARVAERHRKAAASKAVSQEV